MYTKFLFFIFLSVFFPKEVDAESSPPLPVVVVAHSQVGNIGESYSFVGTFYSQNHVVLKSNISGTIAEIFFKDGDDVASQNILIQLQDEEQKARLKKSEAALNLSKNKLKRVKSLIKKGFSTQSEYEQASAQVQLDEADYTLAKEELNKTKIKCPFSGVLSARRVSKGAYVNQGEELVNLHEIDPIRLKFDIPENLIGKFKKGLPLQISTDAFPKEVFEAVIEVIEPTIHESSRTLTIYAKVNNKAQKLKPGLFGKATIHLNTKNDVQLIPEEALVYLKEGIFVYKIDAQNQVKLTRISMGFRQNNQIEIISGLNVGDKVVIEGQEKIKDGDKVEMTTKEKQESSH